MRLVLYAIILLGGVIDVVSPKANFIRNMLKY